MQVSLSRSSPRGTALRVIGATGVSFAVLVAALLLARPEMMMIAMHRAMALNFVSWTQRPRDPITFKVQVGPAQIAI